MIISINPHAPWTIGDPLEFDAGKLVKLKRSNTNISLQASFSLTLS